VGIKTQVTLLRKERKEGIQGTKDRTVRRAEKRKNTLLRREVDILRF
jgi:hypothetical protein